MFATPFSHMIPRFMQNPIGTLYPDVSGSSHGVVVDDQMQTLRFSAESEPLSN